MSQNNPMHSIHAPGPDSLTGLVRGPEFEALVSRTLQNQKSGSFAVIAVIGLDRFRRINDLLGYAAGDNVLRAWSAMVRRWLETEAPLEGGMIARFGGDEFGVLWPACPSLTAGFAAGDALISECRRPLTIEGRELFLMVSAGLAITEAGPADTLALIRQTSAAMRRAKRRGGNTIETLRWEESLSPERRYQLEVALRTAIERGQFSLRFQPQVDRNCQLDGLEVLLTWEHPEYGRVAPEVFIKLAEEIGAIVAIGDWVLRKTCEQIASWRASGLQPPRVAVNVSPLQFSTPDLVDHVERILAETGITGDALEFEITEGTLLRDLHESAARMRALRRLGISLAVDDFGVGYTPLTYLQDLPLDTVKVDRAFTTQITKPAGSLPLVHTITVLAHHRGLKVVAEGVETPGELELVQATRCDRMQGYLFGSPMPAADTEHLLRNPASLAVHFRPRIAS
jgi:diguanylate cyclase (GGDEF)-like protein